MFCFVNLGSSFAVVLEAMTEHTFNLLLHSAVLSHLSHRVVKTSRFHDMVSEKQTKSSEIITVGALKK